MAAADLYFMCNPALGIIKIGIAGDVEGRRRTLECAGGMPLTVLKVVARGEQYEKPLHAALAPSRLLGEWFAPEPQIMRLIDGEEAIPAFLARMAPAVEQRAKERAEADAESIAAAEANRAAVKAARAAARAELKRIKAEEAAKVEKRRLAREARERVKADELKRQWEERAPSILTRTVDKPLAEQAAERRAFLLKHQRGRNAAMLGLQPAAS